MEYDFLLKFKLAEGGEDADDLIERLGVAGCDDAVVGVGQPGRISLDFTREGDSARHAIISALDAVKRAISDAELIEASPDLVGLTDIAELVGVTRQNMRKLTINHASTFPAPIHEGSVALWHLAPVLEWLSNREGYVIEQRLLDISRIAMQINIAKDSHRVEASMMKRVRALVA